MGYQITWKIKDLPEDPDLKPMFLNKKWVNSEIIKTKRDLVIFCLNHNKTQTDQSPLNHLLKMFICLHEDLWKFDYKASIENEEEYWLCGWEYSEDKKDYDYSDVIINDLMLYTFCSKESDPIDDSEYFFEKYNKIMEELDSLEECINSNMNHRFVQKYRNLSINE